MEIRSFVHESVVQNDRKYFVVPTVESPSFGKMYLANPEEYVRQDVIKTLHEDYGYPYSLMMPECPLDDGRRIDLAVFMPSTEREPEPSEDPFPFSGDMIPYILIECKKSTEALNQTHVDQGIGYARTVRPDYFVVTNGNTTRCYAVKRISDEKITYHEISDIPGFTQALKEPWIPDDFDSEVWSKWIHEQE